MLRSMSKRRFLYGTALSLCLVSGLVGCGLLGGGLFLNPFGQITSVQLFDQPAFTVAFSIDNAVSNPSAVNKVNWVFGDGGGFVEGSPNRTTITHRYLATGTFSVTAFIFDSNGLVDQINGVANVLPDGVGGGNPLPSDLPGPISGAIPVDGATNVAVSTKLTWTAGFEAASHDVYLGTDEAAVDAATDADPVNFRGNQDTTSFDPGGLAPGTTFFWRIDEVNAVGITKGAVMSFTTVDAPAKAKTPVPSNGSMNARVDQVLQWTAGTGATSHDVYFGDDMAAVMSATRDTTDIFMGNQSSTNFDPEDEAAPLPGQLLAATDYFWRIDEVGPGGTTAGDMWTFKTRSPPPLVTNPSPADTAIDVLIDTVLTWSAVSSIESFDVYFGEDPLDVALADHASPSFMGNQTAKQFNPGTLLGDLDYFWRIDTLGPGGTSTGIVFTFHTAGEPDAVMGPFMPVDNEMNVNVEPTLSWNVVGGGVTDSFDVYLSTSQSAVNNRQASAFQDNIDVGMTTFEPNSALVPNTQYFWAIDAVGPGGTTPGPLLRFRTGVLPNQATTPVPANNATSVSPATMLSWIAGANALSHDVFFGTTQSAVQNADHDDAEFRGNQLLGMETFSPPAGVPTALSPNTQYFWRIDEVGNGGTRTGAIWQFRTGPGKATNPTPAIDATDVATSQSISWTAGQGATTHDVYFGTDMMAVDTATTLTAGLFKGNQAGTNFNPGTLEANTEYFWRIDEVASDGVNKTKGDVWNFTTLLGKATAPSPSNLASGVALDTVIDWTGGAGGDMQNVYFGTSLVAVTNATTASTEFRGQQAETIFDPTTLGPPITPIQANTTYFWRIDTVAPGGAPVTKGDIWRYTTLAPPGQPSGPSPLNNATGVSLTPVLTWVAAPNTEEFDVYFVKESDNNALPVGDRIDMAATGMLQGTQPGNAFNPGTLDMNTVYLWRIDARNDAGTTQGLVWRFTTTP